MKRIFLLLIVCFLTFSCSDSESSEEMQDSEEMESETSNTTITPPEWIYGKWTHIDNVNNLQSYEFTVDDIIYTQGNTEFITASFKEINEEWIESDPNGYYNVTNESTDTTYLYSQFFLSETSISSYYFEKRSDNSIVKIDYVGDIVFEFELIKED